MKKFIAGILETISNAKSLCRSVLRGDEKKDHSFDLDGICELARTVYTDDGITIPEDAKPIRRDGGFEVPALLWVTVSDKPFEIKVDGATRHTFQPHDEAGATTIFLSMCETFRAQRVTLEQGDSVIDSNDEERRES